MAPWPRGQRLPFDRTGGRTGSDGSAGRAGSGAGSAASGSVRSHQRGAPFQGVDAPKSTARSSSSAGGGLSGEEGAGAPRGRRGRASEPVEDARGAAAPNVQEPEEDVLRPNVSTRLRAPGLPGAPRRPYSAAPSASRPRAVSERSALSGIGAPRGTCCLTSTLIVSRSRSRRSSTTAAPPLRSRASPSRRCSVPTKAWRRVRASFRARQIAFAP